MKTLIKICGALSLVLLIGSSCNKNTACGASVVCKDANGEPVKGATVLLYANIKPNVDGDVKAQGVTDENGKVAFVFKLPAIFDVRATVNSKKATGIIKLEEGKTVEKIVVLK